MDTIYEKSISNKLTCDYLDFLINKVFALLPMFEESKSLEKKTDFITYQKSLIQTINGNIQLLKYNSILIPNILSHLQSLLVIDEHRDYRRHIFKVCSLLTSLKKEVENNGI